MSEEVRRILIVEDDPDTADLLGQQLERDDLMVEVARNGQEAILKTAAEPPDLIIMDVMMPRLDGFETSRFLKAKFRDTFVPIVVLTAKDDPQSRAKGAKFGCEDYLTKPYKRKELMEAINQLLQIGTLERAIREPIPEPEPDEEGNVSAADLARKEAALQRRATAENDVIALRLEVAERQLGGPSSELARVHLRRVQELEPDNRRAKEMSAQLGRT